MSTSTPLERIGTISAKRLGCLSLKDFSARVDWSGARLAESEDVTPWAFFEIDETQREDAQISSEPCSAEVVPADHSQPEGTPDPLISNEEALADPQNEAEPKKVEETESLAVTNSEAEQAAAEKLEADRFAAEKLAAEKLEAEKLAAEKLEAEKLEAEKLEAEKLEAEKLEAERLEAEKLEAERAAADGADAEKAALDRASADKAKAEKAALEKTAAEKIAAEKAAAEKAAESARLAEEEKAAAERLAEQESAAAKQAALEQAAEAAAAQRAQAETKEKPRPTASPAPAPPTKHASPRVIGQKLEAKPIVPARTHSSGPEDHAGLGPHGSSDYLHELESLVLDLHRDLVQVSGGGSDVNTDNNGWLARRVIDLSIENLRLRKMLVNSENQA